MANISHRFSIADAANSSTRIAAVCAFDLRRLARAINRLLLMLPPHFCKERRQLFMPLPVPVHISAQIAFS